MLRCFVAGSTYAFGGETAPTPPTPAMPPGDYLVVKIENTVFRAGLKIVFSSSAQLSSRRRAAGAQEGGDRAARRAAREHFKVRTAHDQPNSSLPDAG